MGKLRHDIIPDAVLVSGKFFYCDFPKEHQFLKRYFVSEVDLLIISYFLAFGDDHKRLKLHIGRKCRFSKIRTIKKRYKKLIAVYEKAKAEADFKTLEELYKGRYGSRNNLI